MEDRGGKHRIGGSLQGSLDQVVERPHTARCNDRHRGALGDRAGQLQVEPVAGAVAVHRGDQQLSRSDGRALLRPGHGVQAGGRPAAVGEHLPFRCLARCPFRSAAAGVDCHDHALATELVGQLGDESRPVHRCGVDTDLVRTGPEQLPGILDRAHPSADGEGDEDHLGGPRDDVDHRPSVVRGSSDVEEDQFIGTLGVIARRQLDRVAGVEQVDEPDALDHPTCVHVQAGDHTDRPQASTPSATVILPSTRALPAITPPSRRSPRPPAVSGASTRTTRPASDSTSATDPTPPEAITGSAVRCKTARSPSRSGPESMPSRSMAVTITAANSTAPNSPRTSETVRPLPSSQPRTATSARPSVPWRQSRPRATRPGNLAAALCASPGSSRAAGPRITLLMPPSRSSSISPSERTPPPVSTGTPTAAAMASTVGRFTGRPERAASRSTTCSHGAPASANRVARATGSPYSLCLSKSPCFSRTAEPPLMSTAG